VTGTLKHIPKGQGIIIAGSLICLLTTGFPSVLLSTQRSNSARLAEHSTPDQGVLTSPQAAIPLDDNHSYYRIPKNFRRSSPNQPRWALSTYTIQLGDSLWKIATAVETDISNLVALNPELVVDNLSPGSNINVVENFQGVLHIAKPGDDLAKISARFGLDSELMAQVNGLSDSQPLEEGALIFLPGARPRVMLAARGEVVRRPIPKVHAPSSSSEWVWPITGGRYFSEFGWREYEFHRGLDIAVPNGTPAAAAHSGVVTLAGWNGGYGYCVIIDHGGGIQTLYGHASTILVAVGQTVSAGEPVILVGSTGNSTGPHLHLEVLINGDPVNPRNYLP